MGTEGGGAEMFVNHCRGTLGQFSYLEWCAVVTTNIHHPLCTKIKTIRAEVRKTDIESDK